MRLAVFVRVIVTFGAVVGGLGCGPKAGTRSPPILAGAIAGLVSHGDTGDPVASVEVIVRADGQLAGGARAVSTDRGLFDVNGLAPGRYHLVAHFAGETIDVSDVPVSAGEATILDLTLQLGRVEPLNLSYTDLQRAEVRRVPRPRQGAATLIGRVGDLRSGAALEGVAIYAVAADGATFVATSNPGGHFAFEALPPATYTVSAYYQIVERAQVEVQRWVTLVADEQADVPLWLEVDR